MSAFKESLIYGIIAVLLFNFPLLLTWINGASLDAEIDYGYLTASITSAGILLGFIGAVTLSKSKHFKISELTLVNFDFVLFAYSIMQIFNEAIYGAPTFMLLSTITGSIFVNVMTIVILFGRIMYIRIK